MARTASSPEIEEHPALGSEPARRTTTQAQLAMAQAWIFSETPPAAPLSLVTSTPM